MAGIFSPDKVPVPIFDANRVPVPIFDSGSGSTYNAIHTDGNAYLTRAAAFADPLQFTLACAFMYESGDVGNKILFQSGGFYDEDTIQWPGLLVGLSVSDPGDSFSSFGVNVIGYNSNGTIATQILSVYTGTILGMTYPLSRDIWYGLYLSTYHDDVLGSTRLTIIELDGVGTTFATYVNISLGSTNFVTGTGYDSWATQLTDYSNSSSASGTLLGRLFRPWASTDVHDTGATAYQKFFSAAGYPVDLGNDGNTPFSIQPQDYLKNPAASAGINSGASGNYTIHGTFSIDTPPLVSP